MQKHSSSASQNATSARNFASAQRATSSQEATSNHASSPSATSVPHFLEVKNLTCGYGKKHEVEVVHGISFYVDSDEFVCMVGSNGCGKTTTLKTIMGLLAPFGGSISVAGKNLDAMSAKEKAKHFAYIPQAHTPPFPYSVADVVILGRTPYINQLAFIKDYDRVIAYEAMDLLGIADLAQRPYTNLSGGQQQLVLIARALAQQSEVLVMDEPTASLDFGNQYLVLSRMQVLSKMGKSVIMVTHDPDHALYCADRVIVMAEGNIVKEGTPQECITTEVMRDIYNIDTCVVDVAVGDDRSACVCVPLI